MVTIACSGCVGVSFDRTETVSIDKPIPLRDTSWTFDGFTRWACQPDPEADHRTKSDFLESWGEPQSKEVLAGKESWLYAESHRWCGVWLGLLIVPVPIILPVCQTFDKITFDNDLAIHASSQRFVQTSTGIAFVGPMGLPIPIPIPYYARAGNVTERGSIAMTFPSSESDFSCAWKPLKDE